MSYSGDSEVHTHVTREAYFVAGELFLQVGHNAGQTDADLKGELLMLWDDLGLSEYAPTFDSDRPFIRFGNEGTHSSLVKVFIAALQEVGDEDPEIMRKEETLVDIVNRLNDSVNPEPMGSLWLHAATPNWLFGASVHSLIEPGPGSWPVQAQDSEVASGGYQFQTDKIDAIIEKCRAGQMEHSVNVVIFDTAPPQIPSTGESPTYTISQAYGTFSSNTVLQSLKPKLNIIYANTLGMTLPPDPHGNPGSHYTHRDFYEVSDHGLFIAGTVHCLAPQANIYLVEIMNRFGVGTFDTIAYGIDALLTGKGGLPRPQTHHDEALIANFSLCLDIPKPNDDCIIELNYTDNEGGTIQRLQLRHADRVCLPTITTFEQLQSRFDTTTHYNSVTVAAAGNDGEPNTVMTPPARFPAAFKSVIGVGAVDEGTQRAWYSNLADDPPSAGVMVSGGKSQHLVKPQAVSPSPHVPRTKFWSRADPTKGMLGLYIGNFPEWHPQTGEVISLKQSSNGWARWSGTSFATGVMSGLFARAAQGGCKISLLESGNFYETLQASGFPMTAYPHKEMIIHVPQGQPISLPPAQSLTWWERVRKWIEDFFKGLLGGGNS